MFLPSANGIPAMIPQIIDDYIEVFHEQRPKRIVEIDGKPVAMAQDESWPIWVTMPSHGNCSIGIEVDLAYRERLRDCPNCF